jgi:hypothetical protein
VGSRTRARRDDHSARNRSSGEREEVVPPFLLPFLDRFRHDRAREELRSRND